MSTLKFMATLLSKDHKTFSTLNSDILNYIFVSCHKLSKMYSPSVLFKDGLKLYVFESLKLKAKFYLKKKVLECLNLDFKGVNLAITHFVTQFTHVSRHFKA